MYKKRFQKRVDEEDIEKAKRKAKLRRQKRFEMCLKCRFFEPVERQGIVKKACVNKEMKGRVEKWDICPCFKRRWAEGIIPVELIE